MSYIGNPIVSTDFPVDYKSGNGSTTAFTLSVAPASVNSIDVQISGVSQSPQTYSVSGTTLTFSAAPPTGTNNIVVRHLGIAGVPNVPAVGSVTPALLSTANAVYWDGVGNVGIGTSSPSVKLDVQGGSINTSSFVTITPTTATNNALYRATNTGGTFYSGLDNSVGGSTGTAYAAMLWHTGAYPISFATNSTERMRIDSSGNVLVASGQMRVSAGSGNSYCAQLSCAYNFPTVDTYLDSVAGASYSGQIMFRTNSGGGAMTERMRISSAGLVSVGTAFGASRLQSKGVAGVSAAAGLSPGSNGDGTLEWYNASSGYVGAVTVNASTVVYGGTSDYRLKEDIAPMTGALAKVAALKPVTYKWKIDGEAGEGFIAHELQEVCPSAVVGEKDAVNADGSIKPQEIDASFLVATLTAAIQELKAELDATKAEVAALKAGA